MLSAEAARLLHLTFRLPRFLYRSNESGTKAAILPFDTVTSATISVDPMYDLRLVPPGRENTAREALRSRKYRYRSVNNVQIAVDLKNDLPGVTTGRSGISVRE